MGSGHYDYLSRSTRTASYCSMSKDAIFTSESRRTHRVTQDLDIKGKVRTCHDLDDEHPESFPIIIALDVTGSMGHVPERLVKTDFPEIMKKIIDAGVKDAQVCFVAVGDHECDSVPLQVAQFEASDELLDNWLTRLYLEGGGGGNDGESYLLAYYLGARCTDTHSFTKRGKKGVLITIGDEPCLTDLPEADVKSIFGGQKGVTLSEILDECREKWDVYHINLMDWSGKTSSVQKQWKQLLGSHFINTETDNGSDIIDIIPKIVLTSFEESGGRVSKDDDDSMVPFMMAAMMMNQNNQNNNPGESL